MPRVRHLVPEEVSRAAPNVCRGRNDWGHPEARCTPSAVRGTAHNKPPPTPPAFCCTKPHHRGRSLAHRSGQAPGVSRCFMKGHGSPRWSPAVCRPPGLADWPVETVASSGATDASPSFLWPKLLIAWLRLPVASPQMARGGRSAVEGPSSSQPSANAFFRCDAGATQDCCAEPRVRKGCGLCIRGET